MATEAWLRGPIEGVPPLLMPVAHSLVDAREDIEGAVRDLPGPLVWARPGGAASVGFHLRHVPGALDRLLTYARGEGLDEAQREALAREGDPGDPPESLDSLLDGLRSGFDAALDVVRRTAPETLLEPRAVGRAGLPSTVLGLLWHAAEHSRRHAGQVIATARIVRALDEERLAHAHAVREACLAAGAAAWEDAGLRGLCGEGRWELAWEAVRDLDLRALAPEER